ncbi:MAG: MFS transporter [Clostridia bacterium]|nr:MFS transporter [Clostridia bacterium]
MKFKLKSQLAKLLGHSALTSFQLAGAAWVALLAARGFSMVEIGLAESVFHMASLLFEIPSGVLSDAFGRKRSLVLGRLAGMTSSLLMAFSDGLPGVCLAMAFCAFSYNFDSGAREALAYDSLKAHGREAEYLRYSSLEMAVYRVSLAGAALMAGLALAMGHRLAYLLDAALNLICLVVALTLDEVTIEPVRHEQKGAQRIAACVRETVRFLLTQAAARRLMLLNAFAGAAATLLSFFLQARLPLAGLKHAYLGPALFVMGLGGAVGSRLALRLARMRYGRLYALCFGGILVGLLLGAGHAPAAMVAGGFAANVFDDLLQVRTDSLLNEQFPSSQRATLVSVSSLCFSLVMIGLSPLAGGFFAMLS